MQIKNIGLLASAAVDLNSANWAYSMKRYPVCAYLCHQIIEKSLKSVKKFKGKNEPKDLWSHNLIDCTNWNEKIKRKYKRRVEKISADQEETRYFKLNDNKMPWDKYKASNTYAKMKLAREIFALSLAYMPLDGNQNLTLLESSKQNIKTTDLRINKLISETLKEMKNNGDYEIDFVIALSDVLNSKTRFYPYMNFNPLLNEERENFEMGLGPEYKFLRDTDKNYYDMYDYLMENFKIKKPSQQMKDISKRFCEIARYDLVTAHMLSYEGMKDLSLFYVNQSIEKSLKSLINLKIKNPLMKNHDLIHLCDMAGLIRIQHEMLDFPQLNQYLEYRYKTKDLNEIDDNDELSLMCITLAEKIYNLTIHIREKNNL